MSDELSLTARRPWFAAFLSMLCPGLGHIYTGRAAVGVTLLLLTALLPVVLLLLTLFRPATPWLVLILLSVATVCGVYLFGIAGAWLSARGCPQDYTLQSTNHAGLYALCAVFGILQPACSSWLMRNTVLEAVIVPTSSMVPNIHPGDRLLVNKTSGAWRPPQRGDLIMHVNPENRAQRFVKRIVGLPGDTVALQDNAIIVNNEPLVREPLPREVAGPMGAGDFEGTLYYEVQGAARYPILISHLDRPLATMPERTVPRGTCFVIGDNRNNSVDSRHFGFVPLGDVLGEVQYLFYPTGHWGRFGAL